MRGKLLLYDPDEERLSGRLKTLRSLGHSVDATSQPIPGEDLQDMKQYDMALLAGSGPEILTMLRAIKLDHPHTEVVIVPEHPTVEEAVEAIQDGAFHYLPGTFTQSTLEVLVQRALEKRMLVIEVQELRDLVRSGSAVKIIGQSPAMQEIKRTMRRLATLDCTVLIRGETGTGKELVARTIHSMSQRADRKFLAVNCGALSDELLSNELFGHEVGAFTGATKVKKGLFEAADGGSILLDEIGDTPSSMQIQLLRALQEKRIMRVGGTEEISFNVRVLAATNRSLRDEVKNGGFREDLYYRLNVFTLRIPPLRERRDDIPLFCRYFLDKYTREFGKQVDRVSEGAMSVFMRHSFPGNVRELENALERAIVLCDGPEIKAENLPHRMLDAVRRAPVQGGNMPTLAEVETRYIREVLDRVKGNKTQAAQILGIDRSSLWRKLKALGL